MWASRSESFRRGTAESQFSDVVGETGAEIVLKGFVDTSAGVGTDLHVTNLPNNGPWRVIVNGAVDSGESIKIREGDITGAIRGYLTNYAVGLPTDASGSGIINGNQFYVELPAGALRFNVSWEYFPDTDNSSTRTAI